MTPYIGQLLLNLSALFSLIPLLRSFSLKALKRLYILQVFFVVIAFLWLLKSHLVSDFSLLNVIQHSHTQKPWLYKVAGTWGNHEGSMLLWVMLMTMYGLFAFNNNQETISQTRLILHSLLNFLFILFMVLVCDPFAAAASIVMEGRDLNPLLQDPLLAIHPPFLYAGYIGFSAPFIYVLSNLIHKNDPSYWIPNLRKMSLLAWTFLTIGLSLGSFWAYYELGWGGWWFWDPVENIALIPWILGLMIVHSLLQYRHNLHSFRKIVVFVVLAFMASLGGTFLVRSGLLTSVHSFAVDPERGVLLLGIILFILIGTLFILYQQARIEAPASLFSFDSKVDLIRIAVIFAGAGVLTIAFGTLYPLLSSYLGYPITVGAPYFQMTFVPMMLLPLTLMALVPWLGWTGTPWKKVIEKGMPSLTLAGFAILILWYLGWVKTVKEIIFGSIALWITFSTLLSIKKSKLSQRFIGMSLAHLGVGIAILGMVLSSANEQEAVKALKVGDETSLAGYQLRLEKVVSLNGANYIAQQATISLKKGGMQTSLLPEKRFYWTQGIIHGETAIYSSLLDHVYIALGEQYENNIWSLKLYYKPFINLLWLGMIITAMAGIILLIRRRVKLLTTGLLFALAVPTQAMEAHEVLDDKTAETRAYHLGKMILCPTCAGQNINDSAAEEATKMRREVRQLILQGLGDGEILDHYIEIYGERIVYQPLFNVSNILLWGFPWVIFLGAGMYVIRRHGLSNRK